MSRVTYGPEGTQILVVGGKYYLAQDTGDTLYVVQAPANFGLKQLTDASTQEIDDKGFYESLVSSGDIIELTEDEFYGKVAYEDRIVVLNTDIYQLQEEYDTVDSMTGLIDGLQNLGTKADFWKNDNYWNTLEDWVVENGIDNLDNYWESEDHYDAIANMGYSVEQYNALTKKARNRLGWEQDVEDNLESLNDYLLEIGGEVPETVLNAIAEEWASGWSEDKSKRTLRKLVDSNYTIGGPVDARIAAIAEGTEIKETTLGTEKVKSLMDTWLAPNLHESFDVAGAAAKLRNNPNYETKLIQELKNKNKTVYGMYEEDMEIGFLIDSKIRTFENITGIKLNRDVDADFGVIDSMLKLNNYEQEAALARKIGYQRGSEKINSDIVSALGKTFGKGVIPAQQFLEGRVQ